MLEERDKGILDAETKVPSSITSHGPGYLDKSIEKIVGFQTDAPLKTWNYAIWWYSCC